MKVLGSSARAEAVQSARNRPDVAAARPADLVDRQVNPPRPGKMWVCVVRPLSTGIDGSTEPVPVHRLVATADAAARRWARCLTAIAASNDFIRFSTVAR